MAEPQYSEVLDEEGHKTGQIMERQMVHTQQLWHEIVNVWIMNATGEVLLQLRSPKVELNPGMWDVAVGTHVKPAEDPYVAAIRCVQNELGMAIQHDELRHLFNIQTANPLPDGKVHKVLGHVFLLKRDINLDDLVINPDKVTELAWKPMMDVISEIGSEGGAQKYYPRQGNYYPQLFDALQTQSDM
ncbi:MAG TPA: NUDIX domain-containing protein [Candidatus Saccharimonadales bacterium]|nr:NUDIX domain-containing protein [Candidatus Saccharimonadales bacterium]